MNTDLYAMLMQVQQQIGEQLTPANAADAFRLNMGLGIGIAFCIAMGVGFKCLMAGETIRYTMGLGGASLFFGFAGAIFGYAFWEEMKYTVSMAAALAILLPLGYDELVRKANRSIGRKITKA